MTARASSRGKTLRSTYKIISEREIRLVVYECTAKVQLSYIAICIQDETICMQDRIQDRTIVTLVKFIIKLNGILQLSNTSAY